MKLAILGLFATIVVGIGIYQIRSDKPSGKQAMSSESVEQEPSAQPIESDLKGYIDYSPEVLRKANQSGKSVVIFFHASWCPNCRALDETLTSSSIPDDILILKADYDSEVELKRQYGVTQQTTMVHIDNEGNKINLWIANAYDKIDDIKGNL